MTLDPLSTNTGNDWKRLLYMHRWDFIYTYKWVCACVCMRAWVCVHCVRASRRPDDFHPRKENEMQTQRQYDVLER